MSDTVKFYYPDDNMLVYTNVEAVTYDHPVIVLRLSDGTRVRVYETPIVMEQKPNEVVGDAPTEWQGRDCENWGAGVTVCWDANPQADV